MYILLIPLFPTRHYYSSLTHSLISFLPHYRKWRTLRKRRSFFFFFLNIILTLSWAIVHYDQPSGYNSGVLGNQSTNEQQFQLVFIYGLPSFFLYLHGAGCLFFVFTKWGQRMIHETQGKKFCAWCAISLVLSALYLEIPLMYKSPILPDGQRMVRKSGI